ncbi:MAG: hypothetical protein HC866_04210 [Leptolyngbyaceae cyanobacterium RU_5_1]|nr:hypothetical protein [Leptolyngbyaceae cyanobacterium RU_5_1]
MQYSLDDVDALNLLVAFQLAEGQFQEAVVNLNYLIDLQPDRSEHYNHFGICMAAIGAIE